MLCCKHCGTLLEGTAKACSFCGTPVESPKTEPAPQESTPNASAEGPNPSSKKKIHRKALLITGSVLSVVILAVIGSFLLSGPDNAVRKFDAVIGGTYNRLYTLAPMEYWEQKAAKKGVTTTEYIKSRVEYLRESEENSAEDRQAMYGDNYSISYRLLDTREVPEYTFARIEQSLQEQYGIAPIRITSACTVIMKVTVGGTKQTTTSARIAVAVQIDFQWYLIDTTIDGDYVFVVNRTIDNMLPYAQKDPV